MKKEDKHKFIIIIWPSLGFPYGATVAAGSLAARERGDTLRNTLPLPRSAAARRGPSAALLEGS